MGEAFFTVREDSLVARHGAGRFRGRPATFAAKLPVALMSGGHGGDILWLEQDKRRVFRLGPRSAIPPEDLEALARWARSHGVVLELRALH
jgi:hypothetical protein